MEDEGRKPSTAAAWRATDSAELFESAFRYAAIGMALVGTDGQWLRVNEALTRILGYSGDELLAIDFQTLTHPEDLDADLVLVGEMLSGARDTYRLEKRYFHRDGHIVWVLLSVSLVRTESGAARFFLSQVQDITEQKRARLELEQANQQLRELSMVDALTRVFNRRAFTERFDAELGHSARTGLPLSLLLADVDHFKRFNDDFGHPAGDHALQRVAEALVGAGRVNDVVARYGGEEFAVVLPNTDTRGCQAVAERMRAAIAAVGGLERSLTMSIGGASHEPAAGRSEPLDATALIRLADRALYAAKRAGRNRSVHICSLPS